MADHGSRHTRRRFLGSSLAISAALALTRAATSWARPDAARPTPACGDDVVTPSQTEGPYFKPQSPQRTSLLESGVPGTRMVIEGVVLGTNCRPIPRALLDFWQADARGEYDARGYRLRGHQLTDAAGRYRLETIVPGLYPGRTRHVHVKLQAPNGTPLTTQLYFPGEPANRRDGLFDPDLLMKVRTADGTTLGTFDFVVARGGSTAR